MGRRAGSRRERGVVLVLVLWVFMTLGVLALDFSSYIRDDAMATLNLSDETRGYYMALAGLNRALYENNRERLKNQPGVPHNPDEAEADQDGDGEPDATPFRPDGAWHEGTFGGGTFAVRMAGEDGKIPLNVEFAGEENGTYMELVKYVVTNLVRGGNQTTGVDNETDEQIRTIVDSILDWRDCDKEARLNGAEDDYYLGLSRPHRAKNGFFDSPDELMQVRGVTPDVFFGHDDSPGMIDVFTPYPRGKDLVINAGQITAEAVRALVPAFTLSDAQEFVAGRGEDPDGIRLFLSQELETHVPGLGEKVKIVEPEVVRVEARADIHQTRNQAAVVAIVQLGGSETDLPLVLSWLDRAPMRTDGPGTSPPPPGAGAS
jgi:type II secretory pathway component PulK